MKKVLPLFLVAMGLMGWTASAADFNLVAYTGNYVPYWSGGTIENLEYIPTGPNGWQRITQECAGDFCEPEQLEIFLFISTDFTDKGVAGIDMSDPNTNPFASGVFSGEPGMPDPYVTINNSARWDPPPPPPVGVWVPIHDQGNADIWNGYYGYSATADTWYFDPFAQFVLGAVQEDGTPADAYAGNFYKGTGLQWNSSSGYTDEMLGADGVLVPYMHLVIDKEAIPCGEMTWVTVAGLPALINGLRPTNYDWLGKQFVDQGAPWVPNGRIEIYCTPEPASVALLALAGIPAIIRRRK
jgi:hypothetical protein